MIKTSEHCAPINHCFSLLRRCNLSRHVFDECLLLSIYCLFGIAGMRQHILFPWGCTRLHPFAYCSVRYEIRTYLSPASSWEHIRLTIFSSYIAWKYRQGHIRPCGQFSYPLWKILSESAMYHTCIHLHKSMIMPLGNSIVAKCWACPLVANRYKLVRILRQNTHHILPLPFYYSCDSIGYKCCQLLTSIIAYFLKHMVIVKGHTWKKDTMT